MGFEVCYKYYEKAEKGYDTDEEKEIKSKVGDPFEEISMEQLAGAIMAQFARRDIMVFDCDIIELSRKKINFKETDGGIIIKNKKYSFDKGAKIHCQDIVQDAPQHAPTPGMMPHQQQIPVAMPVQPQQPQALTTYDEEFKQQQAAQALHKPRVKNVPMLPGRKPLRYEVFCPDKVLRLEAQKRGLAFSMHQRYPIYEELMGESNAIGYTYLTVDDNGSEKKVHCSHFQPETKGLIGPFAVDNDFGGMSMDGGGVGEYGPPPTLR